MNKKMLIGVVLIAVLAVGGYYLYQSSNGGSMKGSFFTPQSSTAGLTVTVYDDFGKLAPSNIGVQMVSNFNNGTSLNATAFKDVSFKAYNKSTGIVAPEYKNCGNDGSYNLNNSNNGVVNLTKNGGACTVCETISKIPDNTYDFSQLLYDYFSNPSLKYYLASQPCYTASATSCTFKKDFFHALLNAKNPKFVDLKSFYSQNLTSGGCAVAMTDLNDYNCFVYNDAFANAVNNVKDYDSATVALNKVKALNGCNADFSLLAAYAKLKSGSDCSDLNDKFGQAIYSGNLTAAKTYYDDLNKASACKADASKVTAYNALVAKNECDDAQAKLQNALNKMPQNSSVQPSDALASGLLYMSISKMTPKCTLSSSLASTYNTQVCSMINNAFTKKDTAGDVSGALSVVSTAGKVGCIAPPVVANSYMSSNNTNLCKKLGTQFFQYKAAHNTSKMNSTKADGDTLGCKVSSWR